MKITKLAFHDFPPQETKDQLFLLNFTQADEKELEKIKELAQSVPIALLFENEAHYQEALKKRESFPPVFFVKDEQKEALLLTFADHFLKADNQALPKELLQGYIASILDKIYLLEEMITKYNGSKEECEPLKKFIHKLAGNSGSYGYLKVSQLCKQMENSIDVEHPPDKGVFSEFLSKLLEAFKERESVAAPAPSKAPAEQKDPNRTSFDLILVDDDKELTDQINGVLSQQGYRVLIFNDFVKAKEEVIKNEAKIILIDINSNQAVDGYELMKVLKENPDKTLSALKGFMTSETKFEDKLKAVPLGVDLYLEKPVDYDLLLYYLQGLKEVEFPKPLRVIVLDDDVDFGKQCETGSKQGELELKAIQKVEELFDALLNHSPHLIFIDYNLESLKGPEVIQLIRNDVRYRSLPIMLISSENDPKMFQETINQSLAGFISKPITPDVLQKKIYAFFEKQAFLQYLGKTDPSYHVFSKQELEHIFSTIKPFTGSITLAAFQLEGKGELDQKKWIDVKKEFTKKLRDYFSGGIPIGVFDANQLLLLTQSYTIPRLQLLVDDFLKGEFPEELNIQIGFARYPQDGQVLGNLQAEAQKRQKPQIYLEEKTQSEQVLEKKKTVLFISSDQELKDLMTFSLSQWNLEPMHFLDGTEGLKWLKERLFKEEPGAIIVDFELEYDNGPILVEKAGNLVGDRIPIIALSTKKYERSLTDTLERGAYRLLLKPINFQNLTSTVLQAIKE